MARKMHRHSGKITEPNPNKRSGKKRAGPIREPKPRADSAPKAWAPPKRDRDREAADAAANVDGGTIADLTKRLRKLSADRLTKQEQEKETKELSAAIDIQMKEICDIMDKHKLQNLKVAGVGTCSRTKQPYPSFVPGREEDALKALTDLGFGSTIKRTIHPQTLKSIIRELQQRNKKIPPAVTVFEKPYIRVTSPTKK